MIIIDDAFIDDNSDFSHTSIEKKSIILNHIQQAGMFLVDEYVIPPSNVEESDNAGLREIERRCHELMSKHPGQRMIFENYLNKQEEGNKVLATKVHYTTMLIKKMRSDWDAPQF